MPIEPTIGSILKKNLQRLQKFLDGTITTPRQGFLINGLLHCHGFLAANNMHQLGAHAMTQKSIPYYMESGRSRNSIDGMNKQRNVKIARANEMAEGNRR